MVLKSNVIWFYSQNIFCIQRRLIIRIIFILFTLKGIKYEYIGNIDSVKLTSKQKV